MAVIFEQVFILLIFVAAGYALRATGKIDSSHTKILSTLLVYVFLPCNIFRTFSSNFTVKYISENYVLVLCGAATMLFLAFSMHFAAKLITKEPYTRSVYEYSMVTPNFGYMGYALAETLTGMGGLMNVMMFGFATTCFTYTRGFCMLTKLRFSFARLLNPPIVAIALGVVFGLSGCPIPSVAETVLSKASGCMAPVSMLLTGIVVSDFKLKDILFDAKSYVVVLMRLALIPICIGGAFRLFGMHEVSQSAVMILAMPCGLNTIVFPKLVGENCKTGASLALISTVLSCISIPLVFTLFGIGIV